MKANTSFTAALAAALFLGFTAENALAQVPAKALEEAVVRTAADVHMERGDQYRDAQKYGKARKEYRAAAELMRADGLLPDLPLRRVVSTYFYEKKHRSGVAVLDSLAKEAAEFGEVSVQVRALADAAWLLWWDCTQQACPGARLAIEKRQRQIERLLGSPYLGDSERKQIALRVGLDPDGVMLAKAKRTRVKRS